MCLQEILSELKDEPCDVVLITKKRKKKKIYGKTNSVYVSLAKRVYSWNDNQSTKRKLNKDWQILYCRITYFSAGVQEIPLKNHHWFRTDELVDKTKMLRRVSQT